MVSSDTHSENTSHTWTKPNDEQHWYCGCKSCSELEAPCVLADILEAQVRAEADEDAQGDPATR